MQINLILSVFFLMACLAIQGKADCRKRENCIPSEALKTGEVCFVNCDKYRCQADGTYLVYKCPGDTYYERPV